MSKKLCVNIALMSIVLLMTRCGFNVSDKNDTKQCGEVQDNAAWRQRDARDTVYESGVEDKHVRIIDSFLVKHKYIANDKAEKYKKRVWSFFDGADTEDSITVYLGDKKVYEWFTNMQTGFDVSYDSYYYDMNANLRMKMSDYVLSYAYDVRKEQTYYDEKGKIVSSVIATDEYGLFGSQEMRYKMSYICDTVFETCYIPDSTLEIRKIKDNVVIDSAIYIAMPNDAETIAKRYYNIIDSLCRIDGDIDWRWLMQESE